MFIIELTGLEKPLYITGYSHWLAHPLSTLDKTYASRFKTYQDAQHWAKRFLESYKYDIVSVQENYEHAELGGEG